MNPQSEPRKKPSIGVIIISFFFLLAGTLLLFGLVRSIMELPTQSFQISLVYIFLTSICFLVAFGIYRHKQWALYTAYALLLYLIINFFININSSFAVDIAIAGVPILLVVIIVSVLLVRKHNHFIH